MKILILSALLALISGCALMDRRRQQPAAVGVIIIIDKDVQEP